MKLLSETCSIVDEFWEARLVIAFQLLFSSIKVGARHPAIAENIILPCLRIMSQACTPPKSEITNKEAWRTCSARRIERFSTVHFCTGAAHSPGAAHWE